MKAYLILEDGSVYEGESFGSTKEVISEIVFNTSMTGYLEVLTDPSYAGQAVVMTYPLIGNYGVCYEDMESVRPWADAWVVREVSDLASNFRSEGSIQEFLEENDILFIDEIHRLNTSVEEILYPAMEDGELDILIGKGPSARSIRVELPQFTLIGATTRAGQLSTPLRDRFGVTHRMEYYKLEELKEIIRRGANILDISYDEEGITEIAKRSRGTPRIANRLLKRARDFALVEGVGILDKKSVDGILSLLAVDEKGLDELDRKILKSIVSVYNGGPVGIETLSLLLGEDRRTVEEVYEPYLVKIGFIKRTSRGRVVTELGYNHLGLEKILE